MNLSEALNYQNHCLICKSQLILESFNDLIGGLYEKKIVKLNLIKEGWKLSHNYISSSFIIKDDMTVTLLKEKPPISYLFIKTCPNCYVNFNPWQSFAKSHTLGNLNKAGYFYSFELEIAENNTYSISLYREYLSWLNNKTHYSFDNYSFINKAYLSSMISLKDRFSLETEAQNISGYNKEDLIKLIETYAVFS